MVYASPKFSALGLPVSQFFFSLAGWCIGNRTDLCRPRYPVERSGNDGHVQQSQTRSLPVPPEVLVALDVHVCINGQLPVHVGTGL